MLKHRNSGSLCIKIRFIALILIMVSSSDPIIQSSNTSNKKQNRPSEKNQNRHSLNIQNKQKKSMSFVFKPKWQGEGKGARVIRVIGNNNLPRLDPFLMLDHFNVKLPAGFPDHPHRGFQTITYMQEGSFHHEDFKGHKGTINAGDIQWMTAGRGIVHSQIPASFEEPSIGFQLWLNLKSGQKMCEPKYQEYKSPDIPIYEKDGTKVKLICGEWEGYQGPIKYDTPAYYMDVKVPAGGHFQIAIAKEWNSIIYVYDGQVDYKARDASHKVGKQQCCVLEKSNQESIGHQIKSSEGGSFMLISGQPLNQPVANHGPFVMNTQEQLMNAFKDYQSGKNGFENAHKWQSKIKDLMEGKKFEEL